MKFYLLYKNNGLYDPVLDDHEPILYEPGDLDPESQPTEVSYDLPRFVEPQDIGSSLIDHGPTNDPLGTPYDPSVLLLESRSLTASPFMNTTKPYRPFSTEPMPEVPPLEDPIILNPNYRDQFGQTPDIDPDYILTAHSKNGFEGKYKLPISEQYDPDGTKKNTNTEIHSILSKYINMEKLSKKSVIIDEKISQTTVQIAEDTIKTVLTNDVRLEDNLIMNSKAANLIETAKDLKIRKDNVQNNVKVIDNRNIVTQDVDETIIAEELEHIEKMRQEMNVEQIERTAHSVVEESIERAISVAEEVKKEMEVELSLDLEQRTETDEGKTHFEPQLKEPTDTNEIKKVEENRVLSVVEDFAEEKEIKKVNEIQQNLNIGQQTDEAEKNISTVQAHSQSQVNEFTEANEIHETDFEAIDKIASNKEHLKYEEDAQEQHSKSRKASLLTNVSEFKNVTKTFTTGTKDEKSEAEQRIYEIGLQTIPNIRGVVHSSYHYDLLLRTFFLHLTDVMVALSRFLLTQPVFNTTSNEIHKTVSESYIKSDAQNVKKIETDVKDTRQKHEVIESVKTENQKVDEAKVKFQMKQDKTVERREEVMKSVEEKHVKKRELVTPIPIVETSMEANERMTQTKEELDIKTNLKQTQIIDKSDAIQERIKEKCTNTIQVEEKKAVSGAQMAQRTEKKLTKDVTQKMDAVISEFQTIAVEEDKKEMLQRSRRSRSRSQIEEEVAKESDTLEWLDKVDSRRASQEVSEERLTKKEFSSTETSEKKHYEKLEKHDIKHKTAKTPKQMYVAIVEAHVYTNKDVIFEDAAEFSETSSVQSAEEVNTVLEAVEAIHTENILHESAVQQIKQGKIVEESQELSKVTGECQATVQKIQEVVHESKNIQEEKLSEINVHEFTSEVTSSENKKEAVVVVEENHKESAVIESVAEVKATEQRVEIEKKVEKVKVKIEVEPQVQIEDVTENVIVKTEKPPIKTEEEYAALKIVKEVETEIDTPNEVIEIEEMEVNKIKISNDLQLDASAIVIEQSKISSKNDTSAESQSKIKSNIDITTSNHVLVENYESESHITENIEQESSFTVKSVDKKLTLKTDLKAQGSVESPPSTIDTPTPSTVPPTPLTDEYVFKLTIPLPKSRSSTPIPRDCTLSPEDEDPHIVKKKLVPHIETTVEKPIIFDPPLPTPPTDKPLSPLFKTPGLFGGSSKPIYKIKFPVYRKPGLFGGADNPEFNKEEIREIERKSSLLATAIDQTIKSIEEYKEEVGMETKKEVKVTEFKEETTTNNYQESYSKETNIELQEKASKTLIEEVDTKTAVAIELKKEESTEKVEMNIENLSSKTEVKEIEVKIVEESKPKEIINEIIDVEKPIKVTEIKNSEVSMATVEISENISQHNKEAIKVKFVEEESKNDPMLGFRPVVFDPESIQKRSAPPFIVEEPATPAPRGSPYLTESGEIIGTIQGIVDGLEEPVMDPELAKELGKPGISEEKIAELISGEAEMLREAHVMGLSRVLNSHMHRADDSSVDFQKIKPMIDSLKDSEVLKALNEDLARQKEEERKKEEKRWTTFLQKPSRPPPKAKFGYHGWTKAEEALMEEPYKVKIVKQAKPKVAPDYKPEDFETGPLPWEQRAALEPLLPPVEPEEPILIPELPEYLEAVDPLQESEVPDLEDTGIPLPPPKEPTPPPVIEQIPEEEPLIEPEVEETPEVIEEEKEEIREDMENQIADQLVRSVQSMVDPNAPVEQQLNQMRAQLAALAQLPEVIQQTLDLVSRQLNKMGHQETRVEESSHTDSRQEVEVSQSCASETTQECEQSEVIQNGHVAPENDAQMVTIEEVPESIESADQTEQVRKECRRLETPQMLEDELRNEKMQKEQLNQAKLEADARQIKQRGAPRVGKPTRMFGPLDPDSRPVVLPGGRRWRSTNDVYNEQLIAETLQAQSEIICGKTMGINFMKYEKPPVSLEHLQNSETYKLVHDMDQPPLRKVEMLKPVIAEADYRERCRSITPSGAAKHLQLPQQLHP